MSSEQKVKDLLERVKKGGAPRYHDKNREQKKLFARERLALLLDPDSFIEDAELANAVDPELPADGVVTGSGTIDWKSRERLAAGEID